MDTTDHPHLPLKLTAPTLLCVKTKQTFDLAEVVICKVCTFLQTFDLAEVVSSWGGALLQMFDLDEVVDIWMAQKNYDLREVECL